MAAYRSLAEMMMISGNRDKWEQYLRSHFTPAKVEDDYDSIIEYLSIERGLIAGETRWNENEKLKRLLICIKVKLLPGR